MVNVATVAGTSASRSSSIWSMALQFRHTRVGGRWRNPQARQRLASKPLAPLGRSPRGRRAGSFGIGTTRRVAPQLAAPGEEPGVRQVVATGGDLLGDGRRRRPRPSPAARRRQRGRRARAASTSAPSATHHDRDRLAGLGPIEHVGEEEPELRRAEVADRRARGRRPSPRSARRGCSPLAFTARAWSPTTTRWSTSSAVRSVDFSAAVNACSTRGTYTSWPNRSSQVPRRRSRRRCASGRGTPASSTTARSRSATTSSSIRTRSAAAPSPLSRSSAEPAGPVRRSDSTASVRRPAAPMRAALRIARDGRSDRSDDVVARRWTPADRARAWIAVAFVLSR